MKYRKKQVVIDARQWDGTWDCALAIKNDFMGGEAMVSQLNFNSLTDSKVTFIIPTEDGEDYWVAPLDYIVKGVPDGFYICKPNIFEIAYEKVEKNNV